MLTISEIQGAVAVTVVEHPLMLPSFPSHLFQGPWDTHWALRDDVLARVFAGAAWKAAESPQPAQSAA